MKNLRNRQAYNRSVGFACSYNARDRKEEKTKTKNPATTTKLKRKTKKIKIRRRRKREHENQKKIKTAPPATKSVQDKKHSRKATRKIVGKHHKCTVKL